MNLKKLEKKNEKMKKKFKQILTQQLVVGRLFHNFEVGQMSASNFWKLSGKK